jgi:hypothetical protein
MHSEPVIMSRSFPVFALVGLVGLCTTTGLARPADDALNRARTATALVVVEASSGRVHGIAVCAVRGGLFATNAHTVRGARAREPIRLVLDPGESTQRIVHARLGEVDEALDLAFLEADIQPAPEPVEIAPDQDLHPDLRVIRLRFAAPDTSSGGYPRASSKEDRVASVTRDPDDRTRVQLDAPLGTKATEGAFFDEKGRLVGIATRTQGPNRGFILPAGRIAEVVRGVSIVFDPPAVEPGDLARPRPCLIGLKRAGPGHFPRDLAVSLTLSAGAGDRRTYPAEPIGEGQFRATVVPLPAGVDRRVALISSQFEFDRMIAVVEDMTVRIGDRPLRLSKLAYIEIAPVPRAISTDGHAFKGRAAGIESIRFLDSATMRAVDSPQIAALMIRPASGVSPIAAIEAEVEVRRRDQTLSRLKKSIHLDPGTGTPREPLRIGALPQPSEALEGLLDVGGWLDLEGPGGRGLSGSIRAPAAEIGEARVEMMTAPRDVGFDLGSPIRQAAFARDGRRFILASRAGALSLWNARDGTFLRPIGGQRGPLQAAAFSPDGRYVLSGGDDGFLNAWNLNDAGGRAQRPEILGRAGAVSSVAISGDGQLALVGSADGTARLRRWPGGQEVRRLRGHEGPVHSSAFLPGNRRAVTAGQDGFVRIWDVVDGRELRRLDARSGASRCVAVSPDGRAILAGYDDGAARLWDAEAGQTIRTMTGHGDRVESVAFSPAGELAATGGGPKDPTVVIWEVATGRELRRLQGHTGAVRSVAFAPEGLRVLSAGEDGWARIRKLLDDLPGTDAGEPLVRDLGGTIREVLPAGGGRYLVLNLDGPRRLAVFDINTAGVVATVPLPDGDVRVAAGASSVFLTTADRGLVQERDLGTLAVRKEWPLPIRGRLAAIGLGSDSDGPLLAVWEPERTPAGSSVPYDHFRRYLCLIDTRTGKVLRARSHHDRQLDQGEVPQPPVLELPAPSACLSVYRLGGPRGFLRPTADGRRFVYQSLDAAGNLIPGFAVIDLDRHGIRSFRDQFTHGLAAPSADGDSLFTVQHGTLNRDGHGLPTRQSAEPSDDSRVPVPCCDPRYRLEVRARLDKARRVGSVDELAVRDRAGALLATASGLEEMRPFQWLGKSGPADPLFDRRFLLIPSARLLITIPPDQGRLVLRRIDANEIAQRPLRALRGERLPGPTRQAAGPSVPSVSERKTWSRDRLAGILRSLWSARKAILGALAALSYLAVLAYKLCASRAAREPASDARQPGRRRLGWLPISAAYLLTFACVFVEWHAFSTARAAARAIDARFADAEREIVTRKEFESLVGRTPDRSAVQEDGSLLAHYEWNGVIRRYTLRVEYGTDLSGDDVVVNHRFE